MSPIWCDIPPTNEMVVVEIGQVVSVQLLWDNSNVDAAVTKRSLLHNRASYNETMRPMDTKQQEDDDYMSNSTISCSHFSCSHALHHSLLYGSHRSV
jgi:hypothetical protein